MLSVRFTTTPPPLMVLLYCHLQGRGMFFNKAKTLKVFEQIFIKERRLKK